MASEIRSEMAGTVFEVLSAVGRGVAAGDTLLVIESMKMEVPVDSTVAGTVVEIAVAPGDVVAAGQVLARIRT